MTRQQAARILSQWKEGSASFPPHIIDRALEASGDLEISKEFTDSWLRITAAFFSVIWGKTPN